MLRFFKTKTFRVLTLAAVLIAVYAIAGFVFAPKLLRSALLKDIPESLGVTPVVGRIRVNPFLLQVSIDQFSLPGRDGVKLLAFERLFVDFELSSIWHRAYSFANIDVTSPYVGAIVAPDGSLNLLALRPKAAAAKPAKASTSPPAVRVGSFKITQGSLTYEDRSRPDVFTARLEPINFELRDFTTGAEGGKFNLTGTSKLGERIEWHGHVSVEPIESDGEFRVAGLRVHTLWEYLEDKLNFGVNSGTIDLAATYKFSAGNGSAQVSKVAVSDLAIRPKDSDTDWITVPGLTATAATVDFATRRAHVDQVSVAGLKLLAWLEPDGSINLLKLAAAPGVIPAAAVTTMPAPGPAATSTAGGGAAAAPWQFEVQRLDVRDASLSVEDRSTHPAVKVVLAPFAMQLSGASQDLSKPLGLTLDTRVNEQGSLTMTGEVAPQPLMANLRVKLAGIDLTAAQPYIAQRSGMTLLDGRLGGEGKVHYGAQQGTPAVRFSGDISVDKLHTVDNALHDDFINWDGLDIHGLNYSQGPDRLDIEQIVARKPYVRVIIESDASLNVKRVLAGPGAAATGAPAAVSRPASRAAASQPAAAPAGPQRMPLSIKKIVVQAGQANFTDLSVMPNFSAGIQALQGTVLGMSSKQNPPATLDLHGSVDTYAPVSITGAFNVLAPRLYTDIAMNFRNIDLAIFNPYSGKFAGYDISQGKLSTELHYKIDDRKLDAKHHIVVQDLEFGQKTESKDAVSLPIKLAVALLKDRNGVIELDLPVTGSLDDPEFRLAPVIWKAFAHIVERAVTAPFALLGSLFGAGPDIQYIEFPPGVSSLDAAATDKIKAVARALSERPQLKIEVPIAVVAELDRPALADARFHEQLAAAGAALPPSSKKTTGAAGAPPAVEQLDSATQLELLTQLYRKDFATEPKFSDSVTALKSKPEITSAKIDFLSKAIRDHIQIGDSELQRSGQERARAVQQQLLADTQLDPERIFLAANDKARAIDGKVQLELSLR
ncbi:MAG: DUF748 domain-containing protein [Pseudomonadota bacterium]|nr:DUF748 domain-containing protein [Pseudomonadota bacterium]